MKIARFTHAGGYTTLVPVDHIAYWVEVAPEQERALGGPHSTIHVIGQSWVCVKGTPYDVEQIIRDAT